jgi:hypothetical protein
VREVESALPSFRREIKLPRGKNERAIATTQVGVLRLLTVIILAAIYRYEISIVPGCKE